MAHQSRDELKQLVMEIIEKAKTRHRNAARELTQLIVSKAKQGHYYDARDVASYAREHLYEHATNEQRNKILNAGVEIAKVNPEAALDFLRNGITDRHLRFNHKEQSPYVIRMMKLAEIKGLHRYSMLIGQWGMQHDLVRPMHGDWILKLAKEANATDAGIVDMAIGLGIERNVFKARHAPQILELAESMIKNKSHFPHYILNAAKAKFSEHTGKVSELQQRTEH